MAKVFRDYAEDSGMMIGLERTSDNVTIGMDPDCGARDETHTVREWLSEFGLSVTDEFVIRWQAVMFKLSNLMIKSEQIVDVETMKQFWSEALDDMYLEYDLKQEFLPQFDGNVAKLFLTIYKIVADLEKEE